MVVMVMVKMVILAALVMRLVLLVTRIRIECYCRNVAWGSES